MKEVRPALGKLFTSTSTDSSLIRERVRKGDSSDLVADGWARILVASDFSEAARTGFRTALGLAKHLGASVEVLYVQTLLDSLGWAASAPTHERDEKSGVEIDTALNELRDEALVAGIPCITSITHGSAPRRIVERAIQVGARLIVVGTRRRPGLASVLGSVAARVAARSPVPIMVVPHREST